jgi:hypothetical protein
MWRQKAAGLLGMDPLLVGKRPIEPDAAAHLPAAVAQPFASPVQSLAHTPTVPSPSSPPALADPL